MTDILEQWFRKQLASFITADMPINFEFPADTDHGDFSTNSAFVVGKKIGRAPFEVAQEMTNELMKQKPEEVERVEARSPGFINIYLSKKYFIEHIGSIDEDFGKNNELSGKKAIIEYTDPNPFKEFHIGHLMTNTIGESLARIISWSGAETKRANYQGDVGLHVAKAVWGMRSMADAGEQFGGRDAPEKLGKAYALGASSYEAHKSEIDEINKKIYDRSDKDINWLYGLGRKISLDYFETLYARLGTKFDFYFFESEVGVDGKKIVEENLGNVFEQSEGAVIFPGEKYGLHNRVFINSLGLPTYEAKELGLAKKKYETFPYDISLVVTGNEVREYFKVLRKTIELVFPDLASKIHHVPHGMLRLPSGKMSSRTGDVITTEELLDEARKRITDKINQSEVVPVEFKDDLTEMVSVAAVKYSILRQATGRDIVFDFDTSLSFEGDSGPYLQYTYARAQSIVRKAKEAGLVSNLKTTNSEPSLIERKIVRFPEIIKRALHEYEPHYLATYLIELAQTFNNWYGKEKIISDDPETSYKLALTGALAQTLKNGLWLLGIKAPERM